MKTGYQEKEEKRGERGSVEKANDGKETGGGGYKDREGGRERLGEEEKGRREVKNRGITRKGKQKDGKRDGEIGEKEKIRGKKEVSMT